jgi:hypothetical protein
VKFYEIEESVSVFPGEYILHEPTKQVVLCGSFNRVGNFIRVLANGKMFTDQIKNFRKIQVGNKERKDAKRKSKCKGCSR